MFIPIYRKYSHYFECLCCHGMAKKTWLHERIILCICDQQVSFGQIMFSPPNKIFPVRRCFVTFVGNRFLEASVSHTWPQTTSGVISRYHSNCSLPRLTKLCLKRKKKTNQNKTKKKNKPKTQTKEKENWQRYHKIPFISLIFSHYTVPNANSS